MARELARPVHPRGARPDTGRPVHDTRPRWFTPSISQHTPGSFCAVCKPYPCAMPDCDGWAHYISEEAARWCGKCGKPQ